MNKLLLILFLLLFAACNMNRDAERPAFSQGTFPTRQLVLGSGTIRFRVYIPEVRNSNEKLPIMLYLHGSDERGNDNEGQLDGPAPLIESNPENFPFVIVFPQCPSGRFWDQQMIDIAMAELDQTSKELNCDESRYYLSGFSLGGYGVWTLAATYPDKFAAVVPMSGRVVPRSSERTNISPDILKLADADDPFAAFAERLARTPIWIFHGANDNVVPVSNSRNMANALKNAGNTSVKYTEIPDIGHVSLDYAFREPELFTWLAKQRLKNS